MTAPTRTTWTPGPLAVSRDAVPDWHQQYTVYDEQTGTRVATVFGEADAHLYAAAPELVDALEDAAEALELARTGAAPSMAAIDRARAIIARIRGEA